MTVPADFTGGEVGWGGYRQARGEETREEQELDHRLSCVLTSALNFILKTMGKETKTFKLGSNTMKFMFEKDIPAVE